MISNCFNVFGFIEQGIIFAKKREGEDNDNEGAELATEGVEVNNGSEKPDKLKELPTGVIDWT